MTVTTCDKCKTLMAWPVTMTAQTGFERFKMDLCTPCTIELTDILSAFESAKPDEAKRREYFHRHGAPYVDIGC